MGTGVGGSAVGEINASPAAAVPFGMIQWGPDTAPAPRRRRRLSQRRHARSRDSASPTSAGRGARRTATCPILPTVGALTAAPETTTAPLRRADRSTRHRAGTRCESRQPSIAVDLAVTTRTGLARFTFPATPPPTCCSRWPTARPGSDAAHTRRSSATARSTGIGDVGPLLRHARHVHAASSTRSSTVRSLASPPGSGAGRPPREPRPVRRAALGRRRHVRHDARPHAWT